MDFISKLPAPKVEHNVSIGSFSAMKTTTVVAARSGAPPYGRRKGWIPRSQPDYGDGGAFPEICCAQYPLEMGRQKASVSKTVALSTDANGRVAWDAVLKLGHEKKLAVYTRPEDLKEKWTEDMERPSSELDDINTERTRLALEAIVNKKEAGRALVKPQAQQKNEPTYVRYTPNQQAPGHNAGCSQRIVSIVERAVDPLNPPKFKHKKIPRGPGTPPPPLHHSPARKLTQQDQLDWKIPPCVSNWKNAKGYTIPLDKRLSADGRGYQDVTINDKFAMFTEDLYIAERKAREEIRIRNDMMKQKKAREEEIRETQLQDLAARAREKKQEVVQDEPEMKQRQDIMRERAREIERDRRLEVAGKKQKRTRDEDRDVSERVALGQAAQSTNKDTVYDARLFNQNAGMDSGYKGGDDESYNVYDKALFADRSKAGIYQHDKERMAQTEGKIASIGKRGDHVARTAPVEFEEETSDPFGIDNLLESAKKA